MSRRGGIESWGPQERGPRRPLWFVIEMAVLLAVWGVYWSSWLGFVVLIGGGFLVAVVVQAVIDEYAREATFAGQIAAGDDPLTGVLEQARAHGGGVYVGIDDRGRWRSADAERAVLLLGPPRSGKSSGVIVPALLSHPGAAVSTSTKPDVLDATVSARSRLGSALQFDPEPDVPSIHTPLAHETELRDLEDRELTDVSELAPDTTRAAREPGASGALDGDGPNRHPITARPADPAQHRLAALGPRPGVSDPNVRVWEWTAAAIERSRFAYDIDPHETAKLGQQPPVDRTIERPDEQTRAADRTLDPPGLANDEQAPELTNGWEP